MHAHDRVRPRRRCVCIGRARCALANSPIKLGHHLPRAGARDPRGRNICTVFVRSDLDPSLARQQQVEDDVVVNLHKGHLNFRPVAVIEGIERGEEQLNHARGKAPLAPHVVGPDRVRQRRANHRVGLAAARHAVRHGSSVFAGHDGLNKWLSKSDEHVCLRLFGTKHLVEAESVVLVGVINENVRGGSDVDAADIASCLGFAPAQGTHAAGHNHAQPVKRRPRSGDRLGGSRLSSRSSGSTIAARVKPGRRL
mmetsp:Transcript_15526/g.58872  ORF Transcript_15526/g.58872 Transcript_15526/m.58872 type:complete len:253 (-) Transcript_15526:236-994(-)